MAIFRQGVKVGKYDIRTGVTKKRAQGFLRKQGIIDDDKGRGKYAKDAKGEVQTIRSVVGKGEGFTIPANFKVKFQMPELLITCSAALFCFGLSTIGWVFFGVGLFGAFARYALILQEKQQLADSVEEGLGDLKDAGAAFGNFISAINKAQKKTKKTDKKFH